MSTFPLRIGTPGGLLFEGDVERVVCRSIGGDIAILARHCNFCTALGMGEASVVMADGNRRTAACIGGMLSVMNGTCRLLATTWEWKEDIDVERAQAAKKRAEEMIDVYKRQIDNYKRSLKASFYMAIQDDCIRKNPFEFKLSDVPVSYTHLDVYKRQMLRSR